MFMMVSGHDETNTDLSPLERGQSLRGEQNLCIPWKDLMGIHPLRYVQGGVVNEHMKTNTFSH